MAYTLHVLAEGYSRLSDDGKQMDANCSCTLLKGPKSVIVDTMTPWDRDYIVKGLQEFDVRTDDIAYVISTHGHSDHTGNNNLFLRATHIVGYSVSYKTNYLLHPFQTGEPYTINENIYLTPTPGHTMEDVTVIVNTHNYGVVAIVGDLFENEKDISDPNIWIDAGSNSQDLQRKHRLFIAKLADWIVPGHGAMFKVTDKMRKSLSEQLNDN